MPSNQWARIIHDARQYQLGMMLPEHLQKNDFSQEWKYGNLAFLINGKTSLFDFSIYVIDGATLEIQNQ